MQRLAFSARAAALLLGVGSPWCFAEAPAVTVDGVVDPAEWSGAQRFDAFVSVQPLTLAAAPEDRRAEAFLQATPAGIAVAIRAWHPATVAQTRTRIPRDGRTPTDRFNVMIDFNADGRAGYAFTVTSSGDITDESITNESSFSYDWDGNWQHAAADFDGGYAIEVLIPWSIAQMRDSRVDTRSIGLYVDRVIVATGERFAYPGASFTRPRFLSDFARVQIPQYAVSQLAVVPYVSVVNDLNTRRGEHKVGIDGFWKPNGDHQFAFTINPDFGQVESDNLVVNFTALEDFFNDKRPFFTDNQSYFDLSQNLGILFYTRRVGGRLDDGSGTADINAAVKGTGSVGQFGYGVFAATEDGDAGRDAALARVTWGNENYLIGATRSRVDRPFLDRVAEVTSLDARWQPSAEWLIRPVLMQSDTVTAGRPQSGQAAGITVDWDMPGPWRQQYFITSVDRHFELNDLGFQSRNDFRYLEWESGYRDTPADPASTYASHDYEVELAYRENTAGERLSGSLAISRYSERRAGGDDFLFLRWRAPFVDDRLSRGNGSVPFAGRAGVYLESSRPRRGDGHLGWYWNVDVVPEAVRGYRYAVGVQPRLHLGDRFDVDLGVYLMHREDWLIWQQAREFGSFRTRQADLYSNLNWFIGEKHELRVKLQALAIDAEAVAARRLNEAGRLVDSSATVRDFQLRNLGFQIRYRYKLASLSDLYLVYSRGGFALDEGDTRGLGDALDDTFSLRDDNQLLLKFSYRFEL
ncbi:MAG: DUF5916 domain-containing protein [Xanthomonadales bacterium]|nr:DUF5916 domain-containing protein [Xanthomonadales bacterium]